MSERIDLEPAARRMIALVDAVPDDAMTWPTPCAEYTVGDLLDHIHGAVEAFTAAAAKTPLEGGPRADAGNLPADWRTRIPRALAVLVEAWRNPAAWEGMTRAGGVDLPAEVAAVVALDELVIHGWDLAKAIDEPPVYSGPGLDAVHAAVQQFRASGAEGLFGPAVAVAGDAPLFDRILGVTGRDPDWTPPPIAELDPRFSSPDATPRPWDEVLAAIHAAEIFWLSTVRRDDRPHVTPLPAMWLDGALYFCTGAGEQKEKNLAANDRCVLTTGTDRFRSGLDVVVEGRAVRVTDRPTLERLAAMWREKLGWPFEAVDGGFHDPSDSTDDDGTRVAIVFGVRPDKIIAFGKGEPYSQTRYRFAAAAR